LSASLKIGSGGHTAMMVYCEKNASGRRLQLLGASRCFYGDLF